MAPLKERLLYELQQDEIGKQNRRNYC